MTITFDILGKKSIEKNTPCFYTAFHMESSTYRHIFHNYSKCFQFNVKYYKEYMFVQVYIKSTSI